MQRQSYNFVLAALLGLSSAASRAQIPENISCIDHEHRYILKDFVPLNEGSLGNLTFIDTFDRVNMSLFCGFDSSHKSRTEIACVSSHFNTGSILVRARVHKKTSANMARVALIEVHKNTVENANINDIIPLVCE